MIVIPGKDGLLSKLQKAERGTPFLGVDADHAPTSVNSSSRCSMHLILAEAEALHDVKGFEKAILLLD